MNKKILLKGIVALTFGLFFITGCKKDGKEYEEMVVVANRGSGSISFINASSNQIENTVSISGAEPMYVVYVPAKDKIYVGDRAGRKVHIVNPKTKTVEQAITVGNGVFHMWADGKGKQLWVNNDIDNTISVIDLNSNTVIQTINVGMKPHDVFLTRDATKAYVSIISSDSKTPDKIFMYSTATYAKTGETNVGKDPHLFHLSGSNRLFVPCQSGQVYILNGNNLNEISNNPFVGAHGIFPSANETKVFVTNITGGQIYSINAITGIQNGPAVNSLTAVPHNIVVNAKGNKMFVTHSGPTATTVSTYGVNGSSLSPETTINVGTNPFGLAYYVRKVN